MLSLLRNHWGKCVFALSSFIWAACTDNAQPMNSGAQPPSESSSSMDDCLECTYGISVSYPVSIISEESSSSVPSSSSINIINSSSSDEDSTSINCYTTSVKDTAGSSYDIFECDNGNRYLKDFRKYWESLKESLPSDIIWSEPNQSKGEGKNCNFNGVPLCVDKIDSQGHVYGGCAPTIECPYKPDTTTYNCYSTTIKNKDNIDIDIVECEDGHKWTREQARFSICAPDSIAIPEDVTVGFPDPGGKYAKNCKLGPNTCIISECTNKEYCAPTIECPYKPDTTT